MRPIKFRAWGWGYPHHADQKVPFMVYDIQHYCDYGGECFGDFLNDNWKVMQFTGLHDKNGKEIWEGDVLGHKDGDLYEVYWEETAACFLAKPNVSYKQRVSGYTFSGSSYEVLGNIYENPELLK